MQEANRTGVEVANERNKVHIENMTIIGGKVGIAVRGDWDITANDLKFRNVETPYDMSGNITGRITNNRVTSDPKMLQDAPTGRTLSGWRRPKGPPLPAYCPECKHVFASRNYVFSGTYFYCWGNKEPCINCGSEDALLSEGYFNVAKEAIEVLRAPEITHEMVRRLTALGQEALSGRLRPEEIIQAAEAIHPVLGGFTAKLLAIGSAAFLFYSSIIGTVNDTWEMAEKLGVVRQDPAVTEKVLQETLYEFGRLWEQQLQEPHRSIFDEPESAQAQSHKSAAPAKNKAPKSAPPEAEKKNNGPKSKKTDRLRQVEHRRSFGRARTR